MEEKNATSATAKHIKTYRIPSDLRSQFDDGSESTMVGDYMGTQGAVVFSF
jgi:hypothetical protein